MRPLYGQYEDAWMPHVTAGWLPPSPSGAGSTAAPVLALWRRASATSRLCVNVPALMKLHMAATAVSPLSHLGLLNCLVPRRGTTAVCHGVVHMSDIDLIVLIPWTVIGVAFVLLCIRLQIYASKTRSRCPKCRGGQARAPGRKPADVADPGPRGAVERTVSPLGCASWRRQAPGGKQPAGRRPGKGICLARWSGHGAPVPVPVSAAEPGRSAVHPA
jgi:hypothetical protein